MRRRTVSCLAAAVVACLLAGCSKGGSGVTGAISATGDAVHGETLFQANCSTCHSLDASAKTAGPTLLHVVGRPAGSIDGYTYSPAMKDSGIVWTEDRLNAFLISPAALVPGTMMFKTVEAAQDRADLIAYLAAN